MMEKTFTERRKGGELGCASPEDCRFATAVEKLEISESRDKKEIWEGINKRVPYNFLWGLVVIAIAVISSIGMTALNSASKSDILNMQKDLMAQISKIDTRLYEQQKQMIFYYQDRKDDSRKR